MALGKIYVFGPTFRAEKSKTRRHLTEFWMVEPEIAYADLDAVIAVAQDFICEIVARVLKDHRAHQPLGEVDGVVQVGEGDLRLHHPELGQVPPRLRLLRAKGGPEAVDPAVGGHRRLAVKLAALRQVGRALVEVRHAEERGRPLARRRREDRRVDEDVALAIQVVPRGLDDGVAHAGDGVLTRRITSYNVCYTKLLRLILDGEAVLLGQVAELIFHGCGKLIVAHFNTEE